MYTSVQTTGIYTHLGSLQYHLFLTDVHYVAFMLEMVASAVRKSKSDIVLYTLAVSIYTE